ncbi:hypothetical protein FEM03_04535 [Phragmitibacter flavus]|uniref:DUF3592 domain-containing protein n=1 Tax=Phragmitibacter flavus TaxID=2576071 RepID=A0A5R8KI49_9BACT|nr:hypothetical protein [Phragmitibacter flavus]TLD71996.1 hypothetical protein FEM03_04535 [Phragmitibacter flavus]
MSYTFCKEMNSSLIWPLVAFTGGSFLLFCGVSTLFWWQKRSRWEQCVGVIKDVKSRNDAEGILMHYPIIAGTHRSEDFQFTGEGSSCGYEVGSRIPVSYDPESSRYFDCHPISILLAIVAPTILGIALYVVAWKLYQNNKEAEQVASWQSLPAALFR